MTPPPGAQEQVCGCKTAEQAGTLNGYMCPWHREKYINALAQAVQAERDKVLAFLQSAYRHRSWEEVGQVIDALRARPAEPTGQP